MNKDGDLPSVIIRDNLSEKTSFEYERAFISAIGRRANGGPLVNATDGGEGPTGHRHSDETRAKLRKAWKTRVISPESIAKTANALRGRNRPPAVIEKIRAALKGRKHTVEQIAANSAGQKGKKMSPAAIENIRRASLGRKHSAESVARGAAKVRGTKRTDEARAKMSVAKQEWLRLNRLCKSIKGFAA